MMLNPYLMYNYKLNNTPIKGIALGSNNTDKAEESFDEGAFNLPINIQGIQYEMNGTLEIEVKDRKGNVKSYAYLIMFDNVSKSSVYGWYEHNLRVIEYTDKTNNYFIDTLIASYPSERININAPRTIPQNNYIRAESTNAFRVVMPYISVKEVIYMNDNDFTITGGLGKVDYIKILTAPLFTGELAEADLFLMIDNDPLTLQNISSGDVTFENISEGIHTIQYGLINVPDLTAPTPVDTTYPNANVVIYEFTVTTFNNAQITLYDVITKLRNIKPFETEEYHNITRIFNIDDTEVVNGFTLKEVLEKTPSPQFFIKEATMFQVLSGIFKYINSIPRLLHNGNFVDKLVRDDFNEIVGEFNLFGMYDYDSSQDTQLYGTRGISPLQRSLPNNLDQPNMESPANNFFKTIRATDVQLTMNDNAWYIPLEKNIYTITKFEVFIPNSIELTQTYVPSGSADVIYNFPNGLLLDITGRTIDKKLWDLKDNQNYFPTISFLSSFNEFVGARNNKSGNIYWEQGENGIKISDYFGEVIKNDLLSNVILEAINDNFSYVQREDFYVEVLSTASFPRMVQQLIIGDSSVIDVTQLKFNIEYITLQDFNVVQNREDTRIINRFSELSLKQSDKQINVELASRKSYGELQRGALPNYTFNKIHYYLDDILPLFSKDNDGYVITQRSMTFYNTYIDVLYSATKDHNRLQEFIGVNQEYRPFEIPTSNKVYDRKEYYNDIIFVKPHDLFVITTQNLITPKFYEQLVANLKNDKTKTKGTFALVWTDGFEKTYNGENARLLIVPINVVGTKQTIMLSVGFEDNQLVANALEKVMSGMVEVTYNKAIKYTDFRGRFDDMWVAFFNSIEDVSIILDKDTYDYDEYPLTPTIDTLTSSDLDNMLDNSLINNGMLFGTPSTTHGGFNPFKFYKDSSENATVQYGASIQSYNYGQFIVGQRFTSFNSLVNNLLDDLYLYTYENNTKYGIFNDQLIKSMGLAVKTLLSSSNVSITAYSKGVNNHGVTVEIDSSLLVDKTSWAIGDNEGNLYLACNEPINEFDFEGTHLDYRITEIGKEFPIYEKLDVGGILGFGISYTHESGSLESMLITGSLGFGISYTHESGSLESMLITGSLGLEIVYSDESNYYETMSLYGYVSLGLGYEYDYGVMESMLVSGNLGLEISYVFDEQVTEEINLSALLGLQIVFSTQGNYYENLNVSGELGLNLSTKYAVIQTDTLNMSGSLGLTIDAGKNNIQTATPTVGTINCRNISSTNTYRVQVTNNEILLSVTIRNGTSVLGSLAPNETKTFVFAESRPTPYNYNINITAQASGLDISNNVNRTGTITLCPAI